MPLDQSVVAYGKRRGYDPMDLLDQNLYLFSKDNNKNAHSSIDSSSSSMSKYSPASDDITLNLSEPSVYTNELSLFVSFYNSLSTADRRCLRKLCGDGLLSYFASKLSHFGHHSPDSILTPIASAFDFPAEDVLLDSASGSGSADSRSQLLIDQFLSQFRAPFIREYFRSLENSGTENSTMSKKLENVPQDEEKIVEEEDDGFNPPWWKQESKPPANREGGGDGPRSVIDSRLVSILDEIRTVNSKLESLEKTNGGGREESPFPYPIKIYNFGTGGGSGGYNKSAPAVCAAVTKDADLACFGCSGDSSIRCFPLRRGGYDDDDDSFDLRTNSKSGIVYRIGLLVDRQDQNRRFLLATSDDPIHPVNLFDLESREKIYGYRGHRSPVWALDVRDENGGMFVTGSYDRTARFYLLDRKDPVRIFAGHESSVDCVRFVTAQQHNSASSSSSYPSFVCTASSDRTVRMWSMTDAIPVRMFHGMKGTPKALTTNDTVRDRSELPLLLACATTEAKIFIWHVESGKTYQILDGILANDLAFSSDGRYLVAAGDHAFFKIYHQLAAVNGEFGSQYVEIPTQISQNLLTTKQEAKFLALRFTHGDDNELVCLTASV